METTITSKKYQHVEFIVTLDGKTAWACTLDEDKGVLPTLFTSERKAAVFVDILLIRRGKNPVNILKRKMDVSI